MIDPGLDGKTVLVTGGAMNIGAAISRAFAAQGARVAVHYVGGVSPDGTQEHRRVADDDVERFVASLPGAVAVEADFLEPGSASGLFDRVHDLLGGVDVLVNNAAYATEADTFATMDDAGLERTYRVNAIAPAMLIAELSSRLRDDGSAAVVNISTDAARGFPGQVGYGTSKAALESLTRGAALDLGPRIRVNAIAPGPVQTGWMTDEIVESVVPSIPLRRVGDPDDIADAAVFLASRQARWITGQVVQVAGGHWL
ncbi:SDR family oxidoreductase [Rhodococcus rhodnii]|uniref:Short chain dehydrogenase n=2 Tax=Rhodococcus rhodnii TaxID=38312 RepID=R7WNZ0_9NOCA|nr:SDR family oxidoreductase [Rhodococcus rhodnii]EOM75704.1 short chain dehydrogenase [Rhodococcus rhodnii LMG 5362]TXG89655.1 SDR family oxidoreductase [Rhodococcus rhodnii]